MIYNLVTVKRMSSVGHKINYNTIYNILGDGMIFIKKKNSKNRKLFFEKFKIVKYEENNIITIENKLLIIICLY